jgi:stalled ribosome rescue protein Dom34
LKRKPQYRRGHPVAVLVGFEETHAIFWNIFSQVVKPSVKIELNGSRKDEKILYNFHESVIEKLKPEMNEGVRSVVVSSPVRTIYAQQFLEHVKKHHRYMIQHKNPNCANFAELIGSAADKIKVAELVQTKEFKQLIEKTTSEEADQVVESLEKHLYGTTDNSVVLYSLKEIEDRIYSQDKNTKCQTEHLLLTDNYLTESRQKSRIHRLMQIAQNKKVKTKVVNAETSAGARISQFGGIVFFAKE